MGYKLLGFLVWRVILLYLRKRFPGAKRAAAVAGVSVAAIAAGAGIAVAGRRRSAGS